jgi:alkyldihydroxyacetonephosphate synthase
MAHMSHAYPDGCSIYFTFAGASPDDAQALAVYSAMWSRALEAAHRAGGTISHHHGVGRSKRRAMRLELGAGVSVIEALTDAADPGTIMARGPLVPPAHEGPSAPLIPAPSADVAIDADSRLVTLDARAPMGEVLPQLSAHGFRLPGDAETGTARSWLGRGPTVREWIAARVTPAVLADPVDHLVAGYTVRLPSGAIAHTLPAPRRAAGPDLFALFAHDDGRLGELRSVTLRVHERNEKLDAWTAPVAHPETETDPAISAWLGRVRPG